MRILIGITLLIGIHTTSLFAEEVIGEIGEKSISDQVPSAKATDQSKKPQKSNETGAMSSYGQLDPFDDVVVLQRKFLPKINRVEFGGSYGQLVDNAFFDTTIFYGHLGYSFMEVLALELRYFSASTSKSDVSQSLKENGPVFSEINSVPESYLGADIKWSPIYGKVALFGKIITPIEQFFVLGWGQTQFKREDDASTIHYGTGLSFGLKKWLALRVGLDFYSYSTQLSGNLNDTHLSIGFSTFFPGADYR